MRRLLAAPALHFLVLGALCFAAGRWLLPREAGEARERAPIELGAARIGALRAGWVARTGLAPDVTALGALVEAEIDEEILLAEARARGFAAADPVVRARLARNLGFIAGEDERDARAGEAGRVDAALALGLAPGDLVVRRRLIERMRAELVARNTTPPSDAEIAARFARDPERFARPARVRLSHVFLARDRHGAKLTQDAARLFERIETEGLDAAGAIARGDAFLAGHAFPPRTQRDLARVFGDAFAREVFALEPGRFSAPIASSYGLHLVLVHERVPSTAATLAEARAELSSELAREHEARALRFALAALRARYEIRVAGAGT